MYHELSKDDVKAMRAANSFTLLIAGDSARLTLIKELRNRPNDGFIAERAEVRREIAGNVWSKVDAHFCRLYPDGAWQALVALVRPGDTLHFHARTNGNGYLDAASIQAGRLDGHPGGYSALYRDELCVSVQRAGKTIIRDLVLDCSICPDNSARPIRSMRQYAIA